MAPGMPCRQRAEIHLASRLCGIQGARHTHVDQKQTTIQHIWGLIGRGIKRYIHSMAHLQDRTKQCDEEIHNWHQNKMPEPMLEAHVMSWRERHTHTHTHTIHTYIHTYINIYVCICMYIDTM